jgi:hypothetical protein
MSKNDERSEHDALEQPACRPRFAAKSAKFRDTADVPSGIRTNRVR